MGGIDWWAVNLVRWHERARAEKACGPEFVPTSIVENRVGMSAKYIAFVLKDLGVEGA
jgi:hypothetical protein